MGTHRVSLEGPAARKRLMMIGTGPPASRSGGLAGCIMHRDTVATNLFVIVAHAHCLNIGPHDLTVLLILALQLLLRQACNTKYEKRKRGRAKIEQTTARGTVDRSKTKPNETKRGRLA